MRVAATWTPDPSLGGDAASLPVTWAALDCIGGWAGDLEQRLMVLGSMTAHVLDLPRVGEEHVRRRRRPRHRGPQDVHRRHPLRRRRPRARLAEHIWIAVDPKDFA